MVNTSMTHVFKHPKFYRIPRDKSDQVISNAEATAASERAPGQGQTSTKLVNACIDQEEPQAPSTKRQAPSFRRQAFQAPSYKRQAPGAKLQAPSRRRQAP